MANTTTHRPVNLANFFWVENGFKAAFNSARPGWGVEEVATGRLLATDGVRPSCWSRKSIAAVIAEYPVTDKTVAVFAK